MQTVSKPMRAVTRRAMAPALIAGFALCGPATAQSMSASEAWDGLQSLAGESGLSISTTGVNEAGGVVTLSGVRIFPTNDPNEVVVSMDQMRIEPRGEQIALVPSPVVSVSVMTGGGVTRDFEVTHSGEIVGMVDDENAVLDLDFASLAARRLPSQSAKGAPLPGRFSMEFADFDAALRASAEGAVDVVIGADSLTYDVEYRDPAGTAGNTVAQAGAMEAPRITFTGTEMDMLSDEPGMLARAFDAGFSAVLEFSTGGSEQTSRQMMGEAPLTMTSEGAASSMRLAALDGRVDLTGTAGTVAVSGSYGAMQGAATFGSADAAFGFPLVVTEDDQQFRYRVALNDVSISPELLTMMGAGTFAGDSLSVVLDLGAMGRLTQELGPEWAESDTPPLDISSFSLDDLRLAVGDSELTGSGAVDLVGGLMAQIGRPMPEANGDFTFDLVGGERLLTRLQSMGIIPQDQLFVVRMMMNGFSRSVGEDHLRSDVAIRPGGQITVNGAPLPF